MCVRARALANWRVFIPTDSVDVRVCVQCTGTRELEGLFLRIVVDVRVCVRARALANWRGLFLRIVLMCVCVCVQRALANWRVYSYG